MDEDVRWIATEEERTAFAELTTEQEFHEFINAFWTRRDPTPDTLRNEYQQEHYRRMLYANQHFGFDWVPGWKTDRGRTYVLYGAPDTIATVCGKANEPNTETWRYRYADSLGTDVAFTFIDRSRRGQFELWSSTGNTENDALPTTSDLPVQVSLEPPRVHEHEFDRIQEFISQWSKSVFTSRNSVNASSKLRVTVTNHRENVTSFTDLLVFETRIDCASLTQLNPVPKEQRVRTLIRIQDLHGEIISLDGDLEVHPSTEPCKDLVTARSLPVTREALRVDISLEDDTTHQFGYWYRGIRAP